MEKKTIYLDNAATTKTLEAAVEVALRYFDVEYFNPSALYGKSIEVARDIKKAREDIARELGVEPDTLVFTSSGSESDNQALFCSHKKKGSKILISATEHSAVYNSAMELKQRGYEVEVVAVDESGKVDLEDLERKLDERVSLVSAMHVNNVTGAINDLKKISELVKSKSEALLHSDGVQAFGKMKVKPKTLGVDFYSASSHKIGAPKGSGFLYVKKGLSVAPLIYGGGQERGLRSSTENVPCIMAFAKASGIAVKNIDALNRKSEEFFGKIKEFAAERNDVKVICPSGAPHILCLAF